MHAVPTPNENDDPPSIDRLTYLLSDDLHSDDLGLWEVVWTLNTVAPEAPLDEKIRLARSAVSRLPGQYDLWRGDWPGGPVALLTEDEKRALAHDHALWHDPEHATLLVWIREEELLPVPPPSRTLFGIRVRFAPVSHRRVDADGVSRSLAAGVKGSRSDPGSSG